MTLQRTGRCSSQQRQEATPAGKANDCEMARAKNGSEGTLKTSSVVSCWIQVCEHNHHREHHSITALVWWPFMQPPFQNTQEDLSIWKKGSWFKYTMQVFNMVFHQIWSWFHACLLSYYSSQRLSSHSCVVVCDSCSVWRFVSPPSAAGAGLKSASLP